MQAWLRLGLLTSCFLLLLNISFAQNQNNSFLLRGDSAYLKQDFEEASSNYVAWLYENEADVGVRLRLADSYFKQERFKQPIRHYSILYEEKTIEQLADFRQLALSLWYEDLLEPAQQVFAELQQKAGSLDDDVFFVEATFYLARLDSILAINNVNKPSPTLMDTVEVDGFLDDSLSSSENHLLDEPEFTFDYALRPFLEFDVPNAEIIISNALKDNPIMFVLEANDSNNIKSDTDFVFEERDFTDFLIGIFSYQMSSWKLSEDAKKVLTDVVHFANENPDWIIEIGGHTASQSSMAYNERLSLSRANFYLMNLKEWRPK